LDIEKKMLETSELVGWCVLEAHVQGQAAAAMALSVLRGFGPTKQSLHSKLEDFKSEIKKNRRWYREGRREVKPLRHRCRRIVRLRVQALHAKLKRQRAPTRSSMTAKVQLHYKRLLRPLRLQGLWRWRRAALAMLQAGLRMQSGTIPVERLWAIVQAMFPPETVE